MLAAAAAAGQLQEVQAVLAVAVQVLVVVREQAEMLTRVVVEAVMVATLTRPGATAAPVS
jgi:hypothetical protein